MRRANASEFGLSAAIFTSSLAAATRFQNEAQAGLTQRVHEMFKAYCYRCHGQDGENEGGLNYVVDLRTLVSRNKVVPGKPDDSIVFKRITAERRPMPLRRRTRSRAVRKKGNDRSAGRERFLQSNGAGE